MEPGMGLLAGSLPTLRLLLSQWHLKDVFRSMRSTVRLSILRSRRLRSFREIGTDTPPPTPTRNISTKALPVESFAMRDVEVSRDEVRGKVAVTHIIV